MSAVVCRKRSTSIFEELQYITPSSKKIRCSAGAASPPSGRNASQFFTPPIASGSAGDKSQLFNHLRSLFPTMEQQYLERALEACGNDLDSAIMSLNDLCLESSANRANNGGVEENENVFPEGCARNDVEVIRDDFNRHDVSVYLNALQRRGCTHLIGVKETNVYTIGRVDQIGI